MELRDDHYPDLLEWVKWIVLNLNWDPSIGDLPGKLWIQKMDLHLNATLANNISLAP